MSYKKVYEGISQIDRREHTSSIFQETENFESWCDLSSECHFRLQIS